MRFNATKTLSFISIVFLLFTLSLLHFSCDSQKDDAETAHADAGLDSSATEQSPLAPYADLDYLLKVEDGTLMPEAFMRDFSTTKEYRYGLWITNEMVIEFINKRYLRKFLFTAEGYRLNLLDAPEPKEIFGRISRRALTANKLSFYDEILPEMTVTDEEAEDFYNNRKEEVKIAHLRVSSEHLADSLSRVIRNGGDWDDLVKRYSRDFKTKAKGGVIEAYFAAGEQEEVIEKTAFALLEGEISTPVSTQAGYHIIKLVERRDHTPKRSFEEDREQIKRELLKRKKNAAVKKYEASLYGKYDVEIKKDGFSTILNAFKYKNGKTSLDRTRIEESAGENTAVTYDGGGWTINTLAQIYNETPTRYRIPLFSGKDLERFIKRAILEELYYEEAVEYGFDKTPEYLATVEKLRAQYVAGLYHLQEIENKLNITDEELKQFYDDNKSRFGKTSFERLKPQLYEQIRAHRQQQLLNAKIESLSESLDVEYNYDSIHEMLKIVNENRTAS